MTYPFQKRWHWYVNEFYKSEYGEFHFPCTCIPIGRCYMSFGLNWARRRINSCREKVIQTPCLLCNSVSIKQAFVYVRTAMCMWMCVYVCTNHRPKYINMSIHFWRGGHRGRSVLCNIHDVRVVMLYVEVLLYASLRYVGCVLIPVLMNECRSLTTWHFGLHVHTHVDYCYFLSLAVGL